MRISIVFVLSSLLHLGASFDPIRQKLLAPTSSLHTNANNSSPLDVIQVYKPVSIPDATICYVTQTLMSYTFANSYSVPYVGDYIPPSCEFNSIVIKWSVTIAGRQFDRLAQMYLGDVEVWRTSTAEPTTNGITFHYEKDLSMYLSLWKSPQTLIFSLNNVYDSIYTGEFNTTLSAIFSYDKTKPAHADLVLPISAKLGSVEKPSIFTVPGDNATVQQIIPANVTRALVSIGATGQSNEEFWFTNVLQSGIDTFDSTYGPLLGHGPFREIQLFIDGMLAGVAWPFPIIFTGGVAPGFWRPIVGIDAYDLREYEIDVTPFLPYLMDGRPHGFTIKIVGVDDNGGNGPATLSDASVDSYWLVDGKILLFYGSNGSYNGTHAAPQVFTYPSVQTTSQITTTSNGTNSTYTYGVTASRSHSATSPFGSWNQTLEYSNSGFLAEGGLYQTNTQSTRGTYSSAATKADSVSTTLSFSYPVALESKYVMYPDGSLDIAATVKRGLDISSSGRPDISTYTLVHGPMDLRTSQVGEAYYSNRKNNSYSFGTMEQEFSEMSYGSGYSRHVKAKNLTLVYDKSW